ncbi:MAG: hypothetical protein EA397_06590 [Deltaproteobacteria bacterium]|nr:MAG: hypothetical protein EA397_06590 [Deltaproteobacteria bacterium]
MRAKKRGTTAEELNLVPIMNLVTILIPFLLMAAQFVSYAVIDSTLPAIGPPVETEEDDPDEKPLSLQVMISFEGFAVGGNHKLLNSDAEGDERGVKIPCHSPGCTYSVEGGEGPEDAYDLKELRTLLGNIKDDKPEEQNVILVPDPSLPYEVLVMAMDATREDPEGTSTEDADAGCNGRCLFPYVVISGGVGAASGGE